ncbi:MAG: hypothetical protein HY927_04820 [Elusimicrobia bacterium]|nr:hypothetical protein [Elusimicrobiota bacterium]
MSVSSHLSPNPEGRLWTILDNMRHAVESTDWRVGALTAFAAVQLVSIKVLAPAGPLAFLSVAALAVALPLGVFAFSPLTGNPKRLAYLDPPGDRPAVGDCLISADDVAHYSHGELIVRLDEYLGGGVTATPYFEDIVGQIVVCARVARRKRRLFRASCVIVGIAQLGLIGQLLWR